VTDPEAHPPVAGVEALDRRMRSLLWIAGAVFAAGFLAFIARGADGPPDPYFASAAEPSTVAGFEEVAVRIHGFDGSLREFCMLLADDDASRAQGMRGRGDLGGYDAMLFAHDQEITATFTMEGVPIPLSAGFFDATGRFTGAIGMAPCEQGGQCPSYAPPGSFRWAIEVPEGSLPSLGVGDGARLEPGGPCQRGFG
jgi:uncharacterized membrane protein (UPF0127 family)